MYKRQEYKITSLDNDVSLPKKVEKIDFKIDDYDKGKFKYFMHKEIHEQIYTIRNTITGRAKKDRVYLNGLMEYWTQIKEADKIFITACGTSWHAGLIGKKSFQFDVLGGNVNTAFNICDRTEPNEILISNEAWMSVRSEVDVKSKGLMKLKSDNEIEVLELLGIIN